MLPQNTGIVQDHLNKKENSLYLGSEMNKAKNDDKPFYTTVSDTITEPLLAIKCVGTKVYNGGVDSSVKKTSASNNGIRNSVIRVTNSSPNSYLDNGRKISDINPSPHKTSLIDYKNEARNREQTRNNWSDSNVRKTSKQINERRQSISSEESLSDYEELGVNHTTINGDINSHRASR